MIDSTWQDFFSQQYKDLEHIRNIDIDCDLDTKNEYKLDFSTNDYLGINSDKNFIKQIIHRAIQNNEGHQLSLGSTGSRLLSGNNLQHLKLEKLIANTKGSEAALVFSSGYLTNASVLSTLIKNIPNKQLKLFSDKFNHASLHHACNLAKVKQIRFEHNNLEHLQQRLEQSVNSNDFIIIVTESVFGMNGDILDIHKLIKIAQKYQALVYIDEAHASGLYGANGYGLTTNLFTQYPNIVAMGTFSKAIGVSGGYVCCSNIIKKYLVNYCGGFIYSTAMSPLISSIIYEIWQLLPTFIKQRQHLASLSKILHNNLNNLGLNIISDKNNESLSHIIPIILPNVEKSYAIYKSLLHYKIKTSHVRPPTVDKPRIRISLSANHSLEDIEYLSFILASILQDNIL